MRARATAHISAHFSHRNEGSFEFEPRPVGVSLQVIRGEKQALVLNHGYELFSAPVKAEKYGRSLSTMRSVGLHHQVRRQRRFGRFSLSHQTSSTELGPEESQGYAEFLTSVAEGFGTDKELGNALEVRDFDECQVINGLVMARDLSRSISSMTENGVICAITEAAKDSRFIPQLIRSEWDHVNALAVDAMARGETAYNTRIIVSPFVEEAAEASGDEYWGNIGYVPHLKRGFVQMYHKNHDGSIITGSLSFDGSDKKKLREVFNEQFGANIPTDETTDNWLRYALTGELTERQAKSFALSLADQLTTKKSTEASNTIDITRRYGDLITRVYTDSYTHVCESLVLGRQTDHARAVIRALSEKSRTFNSHYQHALTRMSKNSNVFSEADATVLHEMLVYSTIEMIRSLHVGQANSGAVASDIMSSGSDSFYQALSSYGSTGASKGRSYQACGLEIGLGNDANKPMLGLDSSLSSIDGSASYTLEAKLAQLRARLEITKKLTREKRQGECLSCKVDKSTVHGCGLCGGCNKVWCDEFVQTGRGLTIKEVAVIAARTKRKFSVGSKEDVQKSGRSRSREALLGTRTVSFALAA